MFWCSRSLSHGRLRVFSLRRHSHSRSASLPCGVLRRRDPRLPPARLCLILAGARVLLSARHVLVCTSRFCSTFETAILRPPRPSRGVAVLVLLGRLATLLPIPSSVAHARLRRPVWSRRRPFAAWRPPAAARIYRCRRGRAREDSNLRLPPPEGSALSTELRAPVRQSRRLIAVISDTHMPRGDRRLPDACVERLRSAELILHAGDVMTATTYAELELIGPPRARGARQRRRRGAAAAAAGRAGRRVAGRADRDGARRRARRRPARAPARALPRRRRRGLRPLAHAAARGPRRLPDLQPRQPDRAPQGAGAHDGRRAGGGRPPVVRAVELGGA